MTKIIQPLSPTAHAPGASGRAKLLLRTPSSGQFGIKAKGLPAGKSFDVVVNKVKVGTLATGLRGSGIAKFNTVPKSRSVLLGFDPQGAEVEIRDNETGDDDLDTEMPDENPDSAIGCCLGDQDGEGETECEDLTAGECAKEGGTVTTATSCLPDPCASNPPPPRAICCLSHDMAGASEDDDPEVECEELSAADCAAQNGTAVQATSCDPNPCQPVPPPQLVVCCVPDDGGSECENLTPDHCTASHGTASNAPSCDPDPCGVNSGGDGSGDGGTGD